VNFSLDTIFISNGDLTWSLALPGLDGLQWHLEFLAQHLRRSSA